MSAHASSDQYGTSDDLSGEHPIKMIKRDEKEDDLLEARFRKAQMDGIQNDMMDSLKENTRAINESQEPIERYLDETNAGFKQRAILQTQQQKKAMPTLQYEPNQDYRKEYYRIYLANMTIMDMINQTMEDNSSLKSRITNLKSEKSSRMKVEEGRDDASVSANDSGSEDFSVNKRRKRRRKKEEIKRDFICSLPECGKSYG